MPNYNQRKAGKQVIRMGKAPSRTQELGWLTASGLPLRIWLLWQGTASLGQGVGGFANIYLCVSFTGHQAKETSFLTTRLSFLMHVIPTVRVSRAGNYSTSLRNLYTLLLWPIKTEVSVWVKDKDLLSFFGMSKFFLESVTTSVYPHCIQESPFSLKVQRLIEALFDI